MTDFVVDASALITVMVSASPDPLLSRLLLTGRGAAPELIGLEVLHALRRQESRGEIERAAASAAASRVMDIPVLQMSHRPLLRRIWELRGAVTVYDAAYVALAEQLRVPLLTCDSRLARANGHHAEIIAFPVP